MKRRKPRTKADGSIILSNVYVCANEEMIEKSLSNSYFEFDISSNPNIDDPLRANAESLKNYKEKSFVYYAFYFGKKDLRIYPVANNQEGKLILIPINSRNEGIPIQGGDLFNFLNKKMKGGLRNSWEVFNNHAHFKSILYGLLIGYYMPEFMMPEFSEEEINQTVGKKDFGANIGKVAEVKSFSDTNTDRMLKTTLFFYSEPPDYPKLLSMVRDDPYLLFNKKVLGRFIDILIDARYSRDAKSLDCAKKLLSDYLISKNKGGRKSHPTGVHLELAINLLKLLARSLSKKCRSEKDCYTERQGERLDVENYKEIKQWAEQNHELRISKLSLESLSTLIFKPAKYAEDLVETYLNTSIKTVSRITKKATL